MLTDDEGIQSAAMWGLYCAIIAFLFSFQPLINQIFVGSSTVKFISLEGFLALLFLSAIMHVRGYIYLGSKFDLKSLKTSAWVQVIALGIMGLSIIASIVVAVFGLGTGDEFNALIGFCFTFIIIAEALFIYSMVKLYRKVGILALCAILVPLWPVFLWYGWPTILFVIPSALLLLKAKSME